MRRRSFIGLIGAAALNVARPAIAQKKADLPLVGILLPTAQKLENERVAAVRQGLQQKGFTEGTNYSLAVRCADGHFDRLPSLAKELGSLKPRVIVAAANAARLVQGLFPELPVVFTAIAADPIALGLVLGPVHVGNPAAATGAASPPPQSTSMR